MPFGLKGAPLTFQRTMNNISGGMLGNSVYRGDVHNAAYMYRECAALRKSVLCKSQKIKGSCGEIKKWFQTLLIQTFFFHLNLFQGTHNITNYFLQD